MIKRGIVKGKLSVDSAEQRLAGLCPLMPEEVSNSINIYGFSLDKVTKTRFKCFSCLSGWYSFTSLWILMGYNYLCRWGRGFWWAENVNSFTWYV